MIIKASIENSKDILDLLKIYSENCHINIDSINNDIQNNNYSNYYIYVQDDKVIGMINFHKMIDYAEIIDIVVLPEYRQKGIASKLIEKALQELELCEITLEVKESNEKAIKLYSKYEFKIISERKNYYKNESAYIMKRERK